MSLYQRQPNISHLAILAILFSACGGKTTAEPTTSSSEITKPHSAKSATTPSNNPSNNNEGSPPAGFRTEVIDSAGVHIDIHKDWTVQRPDNGGLVALSPGKATIMAFFSVPLPQVKEAGQAIDRELATLVQSPKLSDPINAEFAGMRTTITRGTAVMNGKGVRIAIMFVAAPKEVLVSWTIMREDATDEVVNATVRTTASIRPI